MALSPWPANDGTQIPALSAATNELGRALALHATLDAELIWRLGAAASALVEEHAPLAPQAIRNEAVVRCAGWLLESPSSGIRSSSEGDIRTSFSPTMTGALRTSSAMSLLRPWAKRRAGAIG